MIMIYDLNKARIYGPFDSEDHAKEWLVRNGIYEGQYEEQEVAIHTVWSIDHKLEMI